MKKNLNTHKILHKFYIKHRLVLLLLSTLLSFKASALNYYWVGGSGNWDNLSHWATTSGGTVLHNQIPTAVDDVFFDANSFTASGQTVTINVLTAFVHNMSWTGVTNTPRLTGSSPTILKLYGSVVFVSGMDQDFYGAVYFEATTTGQTVTMGGKSFQVDAIFNGIGGGWTFQDAFSVTRLLALNAGTLNTNNKTVNAGMFSAGGSAQPRVLNMGSSVFNIDGSWSASVPGQGLTLNSGTSVINCINAGSSSFNSTGFTYYDVNFTSTNIQAVGTISDGNTFHDVVFSSNASIIGVNIFHNATLLGDGTISNNCSYTNLTYSGGHTYTLTEGTTQTVSGVFTANGNCGAFVNIHSAVSGTQATISHPAGAVTTSFLILKDIKSAGGGTFTATNSIDLGNNTGWTITGPAPKNLYWINNTGNWDDGNHWSLTSGGAPSGCSPSPVDNVFFDANSFSSAGKFVTINVLTAYCKNMTWTGVTNTPELFGTEPNILKIYGSLVFAAGMIENFFGKVYFEATTPGQTITMGSKSFRKDVIFNGIGGAWTLQDAFSATETLRLNSGTLNSNNKTVNAGGFSSTGSLTRALNMGSSIFNITDAGNWEAMPTGMSINSGTSVINCIYTSTNFAGGGFTYYDLNFTSTSSGSVGAISGDNTFHNVVFFPTGYVSGFNTFLNATFHNHAGIQNSCVYQNLTFSAGRTYVLANGTTQTVNGVFTANGNCGGFIDIQSGTSGSQATISHPPGTVTTSFLILKDIKTAGGGTFTATNSVDMGNNTGWTITGPAPKNLYWINNDGNWSDGNHWSLTSGGAPSGCAPSPVDNVFFDVNSFSLAGQTVTINVSSAYCKNMTWTGVTNTPTLAGDLASTFKLYGSLTFVPGMNQSFAGPVYFESTTTGQTITMAGKSVAYAIFNGIGGGWTLQDAFSASQVLRLDNGTLNSNNKTVNAGGFSSNSGATRVLNMGSSIFNVSDGGWTAGPTGMTLNSGTSVINCTYPFANNFSSTGLTYYDLNFTSNASGASCTITGGGNTFHDVVFSSTAFISDPNTFHDAAFYNDCHVLSSCTYENLTYSAGYTYTLWAGTTQTVSNRWFMQGSCSSFILLQSNNPGSFATVTKPGGQVLGFNAHIKDIHCTGGAIFHAYNSIDLGGNTGWIFSLLPPLAPPSIVTGPSTICAGATGVVYRTTPVPGAIYYNWTVPPGATITSGQGDTLIVVNFGTAVSGSISVLTFNGCNYSSTGSVLAVVLATELTPAVTIVANPAGPICTGTPVTFAATATNTGSSSVVYDFKVNNSSVQSGASNIYTTTTLANGNTVTCTITISGGTCYTSTTATSNTISVSTTSSGSTPTVSIVSNPTGPICSGTSITFTATATTNGTGTIAYNFKVNGVTVQNGASNTYTATTLANGSNVTCTISISGGTCYSTTTAVSNTITVAVSPGSTPATSVVANPAGPICSGTNVSFTATASNTGTGTIAYNFKVNGISVQNGSSNVYSSTSLVNGDIVSCTISVTGGTCLASNTASSNTIIATILPKVTPSISVVASSTSVCALTPVSFTATAINGGSGASYQWKVNGINAGTNNSVFTSSSLNNGDIVSCTLTSSLSCVTNSTATSETIPINVIACSCIPTIPNAITPNGDGINDEWIISYGNCIRQTAVWVYNRYGSLIYHSDKYQNDWKGTYKSKDCPDGTYYYVIKTKSPGQTEQVFKGNITILR